MLLSKPVSYLAMCFKGKFWDIDYCSCFLLVALHKWLYFASTFLVIFSPKPASCYTPGRERAAALRVQPPRNRVRREWREQQMHRRVAEGFPPASSRSRAAQIPPWIDCVQPFLGVRSSPTNVCQNVMVGCWNSARAAGGIAGLVVASTPLFFFCGQKVAAKPPFHLSRSKWDPLSPNTG